jgi:hypothetical protein
MLSRLVQVEPVSTWTVLVGIVCSQASNTGAVRSLVLT